MVIGFNLEERGDKFYPQNSVMQEGRRLKYIEGLLCGKVHTTCFIGIISSNCLQPLGGKVCCFCFLTEESETHL